MSAATLAPSHDALLPQAPGGNGPGVVLALLVHAALAAALTVSVDWRVKPPDAVSAELWASVPQIAAPAPETPAPTPPSSPTPAAPAVPTPAPAPPPAKAAPAPAEPDIATQRAERRRIEAERQRLETEAEAARKKAQTERKRADEDKQRAEDDRKKREQAEQAAAAAARDAKADEERLVRQREENLRRMMSQAGTGPATSTGTAAQSAAPSVAYTGRLVALIRGKLVFTGSTPDNNAAEVEVTAAAGGAIISRRLVKSSGHKEWDDAVVRAIDRTATLPRDADGRVPPRLIIAFRPRE